MGSGNDFARALGLKKDLTHLIESTKQALKEITVYTYQKGLVLNSLDLGFASWVINHVATCHSLFGTAGLCVC